MAGKKSGPERVQQALREAGLEIEVRQLPESTRTASEAAAAVGCRVAQIAKSLVFQGKESGRPLLVIASGANRVDERKVKALIGEDLRLAAPDFVREQTGFAIGGVPPLGHSRALKAVMDEDLLQFDRIWAAAGSPKAVFPVDPQSIVEITGAQVAVVRTAG